MNLGSPLRVYANVIMPNQSFHLVDLALLVDHRDFDVVWQLQVVKFLGNYVLRDRVKAIRNRHEVSRRVVGHFLNEFAEVFLVPLSVKTFVGLIEVVDC